MHVVTFVPDETLLFFLYLLTQERVTCRNTERGLREGDGLFGRMSILNQSYDGMLLHVVPSNGSLTISLEQCSIEV